MQEILCPFYAECGWEPTPGDENAGNAFLPHALRRLSDRTIPAFGHASAGGNSPGQPPIGIMAARSSGDLQQFPRQQGVVRHDYPLGSRIYCREGEA